MKLRKTDDGGASFYCPGCKEMHHVTTKWNIDFTSDTITPSVLTWNDPNPKADPKYDPTGKYRNGFRCHSFITAGRIQFLNDCTHELAGKTVDLKDI